MTRQNLIKTLEIINDACKKNQNRCNVSLTTKDGVTQMHLIGEFKNAVTKMIADNSDIIDFTDGYSHYVMEPEEISQVRF